MSALPHDADVYRQPAKLGISGQDTLVGMSQGWRLSGAIKTAERKLVDKTLVHGGQRLMA
jgi:phage terminase large subunit-like protein